jgi:hypothetical protein
MFERALLEGGKKEKRVEKLNISATKMKIKAS